MLWPGQLDDDAGPAFPAAGDGQPAAVEFRELLRNGQAEAKTLLIDKGYDEKYGARPLRRAVEHFLEDPLAEAILRDEVKEGEPILVDRDGEVLIFKQKTPRSPASEVTS